jgi:hypothetical protein
MAELTPVKLKLPLIVKDPIAGRGAISDIKAIPPADPVPNPIVGTEQQLKGSLDLLSLQNQFIISEPNLPPPPRVSDSPPLDEKALNGPDKDALIAGEIRKQAAIAGTAPAVVDSGIAQIKANNAQMDVNQPILDANGSRWSELNNNPDYRIDRDDTPEKTAEDLAKANNTFTRFTQNQTDPQKVAFWTRIRDRDIAEITARQQAYSAYSSDPARVANVAQIKAEIVALNAQRQELLAPQRDNRQIMTNLGIGNVVVNVTDYEQQFLGMGSNGPVSQEVAKPAQDSLSNVAQQLGRTNSTYYAYSGLSPLFPTYLGLSGLIPA